MCPDTPIAYAALRKRPLRPLLRCRVTPWSPLGGSGSGDVQEVSRSAGLALSAHGRRRDRALGGELLGQGSAAWPPIDGGYFRVGNQRFTRTRTRAGTASKATGAGSCLACHFGPGPRM